MKSLYVISKHILYNVGGAEKSTLKYADALDFKKKVLLGFKNPNKKIVENSDYEIQFMKPKINVNRFYFLEYFLNKKKVKQYLKSLNDAHIITYGIYFPFIINQVSNCYKELHIRSETDLGIFINYNTGLKFILKSFFKILEYPFQYFYIKELKKAILKADKIVCNSKFIQSELLKLYDRESEVVYPTVTINKEGFQSTKEGIVFIGDARIKGLNIVKEVAKKMPEHDFYIYGRNTFEETRIDNVIYCPWQDDILNIYRRAKLIIVPSLWKEAYGRVAREGVMLEIPVLASDIGGLKEAVDYDVSKLIKKYTDVDEWVKRIKDTI